MHYVNLELGCFLLLLLFHSFYLIIRTHRLLDSDPMLIYMKPIKGLLINLYCTKKEGQHDMCWIKTQQEVLWKLYGVPLNLFHVSWCAYTNNWQDVKHTSCIISIFYENFYLFKRRYIFLFKEALFLDYAAPFFECKKENR